MGIVRALFCFLAAALSLPAAASFYTFELEQLYSNVDGSIQFIVLMESAGLDGQSFLTGHLVKSTQGAVQHTFPFLNDLPSSGTANHSILIATPAFAALGIVTPDYVMPAGFLFTGVGAVNYAGVDSINYAALPTDGVNALNRNGTTSQNQAKNFAGASGTVPAGPTTVTVVEYHHATFDHYFITP